MIKMFSFKRKGFFFSIVDIFGNFYGYIINFKILFSGPLRAGPKIAAEFEN